MGCLPCTSTADTSKAKKGPDRPEKPGKESKAETKEPLSKPGTEAKKEPEKGKEDTQNLALRSSVTKELPLSEKATGKPKNSGDEPVSAAMGEKKKDSASEATADPAGKKGSPGLKLTVETLTKKETKAVFSQSKKTDEKMKEGARREPKDVLEDLGYDFALISQPDEEDLEYDNHAVGHLVIAGEEEPDGRKKLARKKK